jgi:hypothetical protein
MREAVDFHLDRLRQDDEPIITPGQPHPNAEDQQTSVTQSGSSRSRTSARSNLSWAIKASTLQH